MKRLFTKTEKPASRLVIVAVRELVSTLFPVTRNVSSVVRLKQCILAVRIIGLSATFAIIVILLAVRSAGNVAGFKKCIHGMKQGSLFAAIVLIMILLITRSVASAVSLK
ncbi:MAG: hypothetical protein AAB766_02950 [Patescibacteria group bacterium]